MVDEEIIRHLPKSYQTFYKICKEAGLESNIIEKDDKNNDVKSQNFNKKSKHIQKPLFLDDTAQALTS